MTTLGSIITLANCLNLFVRQYVDLEERVAIKPTRPQGAECFILRSQSILLSFTLSCLPWKSSCLPCSLYLPIISVPVTCLISGSLETIFPNCRCLFLGTLSQILVRGPSCLDWGNSAGPVGSEIPQARKQTGELRLQGLQSVKRQQMVANSGRVNASFASEPKLSGPVRS